MNRAFTLIEIILVVALSTLLFLALTSLYHSFTQLYAQESAGYSARTSAGRVIRGVESVVLPASRILSSHTFSTGLYVTGAETLVVEIPSVDEGGSLMVGFYDYAVVYQDGTSALLRIEAGEGSARVSRQVTLGTSILNLDFSYDNIDVTNAHSVTTAITVRAQEGHEQATITLEETVRARNLTL
jgi:prepilin-type N-terminal cleavage/methylation domain-containing protein